jgi:hypothetical protein
MTESEWLTVADPEPMLTFLRSEAGLASERKLRLFACACCRQIWDLLPDRRGRVAVEVAESFADGRVSRLELATAVSAALRPAGQAAQEAYFAVYWAAKSRVGESVLNTCYAAAGAAGRSAPAAKQNPGAAYNNARDAATRGQADLLREIFGNPFRQAPELDPAWLSWNNGTVRALAEAVYEDRDFDLLPVLADALEEAGCADADVLAHCRRGGKHVRGCWVLDLLRDAG